MEKSDSKDEAIINMKKFVYCVIGKKEMGMSRRVAALLSSLYPNHKLSFPLKE
jgi:hypothetical protein